ncbi:MAG: dienelactone hydrolase family protein [Alphaproteobacteria bacterium]
MDRRIIALYDEYTHAPLDRRVFLERLTKLAGGTAAAYALLPLLENNYANAEMIPANDPGLISERITIPNVSGDVKAYFTHPKDSSKRGGVVVIHENRGLNAHIEDVARRVAKAGFNAVAVDLLSPMGGTPQNEDQARDMIGKLDAKQTVANLRSAVAWLKNRPDSNGKVGVVGFCWGGGMVNQLAVAEPNLNAAVAYYGPQPPADQVANIKAPLLLHYAGLDERINQGIPGYKNALDQAGKKYTVYIYDGVDHAFNNDTNAARYNKDAAELAWGRTIEFFKMNLT